MKKIITFFAAISMLTVSCQQENITNDDENTSITTGRLTASMMGRTKVSYTVIGLDYEDWDYWEGLMPAWEVGDEIIGFDNSGNTYTLTVDSIDADGVATLSGTVPDGDLHLIYKYGAQESDIEGTSLTVDYSGQAGDKTMPAVMLADGTVEDGGGNFTFTNAGAVISVWYADGLPLDSTVTKITLSGANLSGATIALDGSNKLTLTATENADDAITVDGLDLKVVVEVDEGVDEDGPYHYETYYLSSPVWIAVPDGAVIEKVTFTVPTTIEPRTIRIPSTASDYVTIGGKKWAKWNIGATDEKEYGWYFAWGDTEGYFRGENVWLYDATTIDIGYSYVPRDFSNELCSYLASAGTYCYSGCGGGSLKKESPHEYDWTKAPFNNGNNDVDYTYFESIRGTVCPGNILASDYDAAHVKWGGTWRMPTRDDFKALINACGGTGGTCTMTELPSATPGIGIYCVSAEQTYIEDYTGVAGYLFCDGTSKLFFPAARFGDGSNLNQHANGFYWSSSFAGLGNAYCMQLGNIPTSPYPAKTDFIIRMRGCPIRPVSD